MSAITCCRSRSETFLGRSFSGGCSTRSAPHHACRDLLLCPASCSSGGGALFARGDLTATTQTLGWMMVFFFASPAASAAYLTVSETFPIEIRALAIALFYAFATGDRRRRRSTRLWQAYRQRLEYRVCSPAICLRPPSCSSRRWSQLCFAVAAERKSLEQVAAPLSLDP